MVGVVCLVATLCIGLKGRLDDARECDVAWEVLGGAADGAAEMQLVPFGVLASSLFLVGHVGHEVFETDQ